MLGKLKNVQFFDGDRIPVNVPKGEIVIITNTENHHTFGKRYKIAGYDKWFEANCFEYIEED